MFRAAPRAVLRAPVVRPSHIRAAQARRLISTAPPAQKSRSWKSSLMRWGLAAGAVYYYNTSTIFAEQPSFSFKAQNQGTEDESLPTLDSLSVRKRKEQPKPETPAPAPVSPSVTAAVDAETEPQGDESTPVTINPEELEEEAGQQAAFNPETGEINWDCPCLGGLAHGPCGEQFREAFSCFVFSKEEPQGVDCVEKFMAMQDCFRAHPDVYPTELDDDIDEKLEQQEREKQADAAGSEPATAGSNTTETDEAIKEGAVLKAVAEQNTDELVPKAWHNTEEKNKETEN